MSDPFISTTYNDSRVVNLLTQLQNRVGNLQAAFADIGEEAIAKADEGFEREEDPYGVKWAPLSAKTLSWKSENTRILKILQSTGRLRASLTYQVFSDRVVVGTNVAYAKKHQLGIGVQQRQFLGIGPELRIEIISILNDHLLNL